MSETSPIALPITGRVLVLKHIIAAIPVYIATIFPFTRSNWARIEQYLWTYSDGESWCITSLGSDMHTQGVWRLGVTPQNDYQR